MEVNWLRPETALWRTADTLAITSLARTEFDFDLGCGDGLNSYLLAGGQPPLDVDSFVDIHDTTPEAFFKDTVDIYDSAVANGRTIAPPPRQIHIGLDHKAHLLNRAAGLNLYERLICHDANERWPIPDHSVQSLFSNVIYWLADLRHSFLEIARVLAPEGTALLLLPDENLKLFSASRWVTEHGWQWASHLDRGRLAQFRHRYSEQGWCNALNAAGLRVQNHRAFINDRLVQIHEIGLRPLSPVLIKMANKLSPNDRASIKLEWVEYCMALALPMFLSGWLTDESRTQNFHAFLVARQ